MPDEYVPYTSKAGRVVKRSAGNVKRAAEPRPRHPKIVNKERDFTAEEWEFLKAMDHYKRTKKRPFPTWKEVLDVLKSLGYRKMDEPLIVEEKP